MRSKRRREARHNLVAHENARRWPDPTSNVDESDISAFLARNKSILNALKDFIDVDSDQYVSKVRQKKSSGG